MVREKDEHFEKITNLSIDNVRCCYFDERNLQVIEDVKDHKITTSPLRLIFIYESRRVNFSHIQ